MTSKDLHALSDSLLLRSGLNRPLSLSEMLGMAAQLSALADRVSDMENRPIPPAKRFPVIQGGGGPGDAA